MSEQVLQFPVNKKDPNLKLRLWQQIVVDEIEGYESFVDTQDMQGLGDYEISRLSSVQVRLRKNAGHTFLAAYLAQRYPAIVVYFDAEHYEEVKLLGEIRDSHRAFHENTQFISVFEMRNDILLSNKVEWANVHRNRLAEKFQNKKIVIVDRSDEVKSRFPEIVEFIYQVTKSAPTVLLG